MINYWKQSIKKYPITKFFIKLIIAEWIVILVQLIVPQWLYRWH